MDKLQYIQTMKNVGAELEHYVDEDGQRLSVFGPVSRVNILVGPTNSGKSRFMRGLIKGVGYAASWHDPSSADPGTVLNTCTRLSRQDFHILARVNPDSREYDPDTLSVDSPWLLQQLQSASTGNVLEIHLTPRDFRALRGQLEQELTDPTSSTQRSKRRARLGELVEKYRLGLPMTDVSCDDFNLLTFEGTPLSEDVAESILTVIKFIDQLSLKEPQELQPTKVYIPVLRTAVPLEGSGSSSTDDQLALTVIANYQLDPLGGKVEVFTGNQLYSTIQKERSGDADTHRRLRSFERFLGQAFFEGMSIELVPLDAEYAPGRHLALFIDEQVQRSIEHIGDGVQASIILMYRLFTAEPGTWLFIEEPEQGLHPGLQRIFLETVAHHPDLQEKDITVFMSTHSNHLLGMAISDLENLSVFSFQRRADPERFEVRPIHTSQRNLLSLLGVSNSSVFLANCGIWVEGITDRKYLRAFLSAYLASEEFRREHSFIPQEDVHYAFFEYAGSNLVHYLFEAVDSAPTVPSEQIRARFLCNRIFLLADQDENKQERHRRLEACQSNTFRYYVTPGVEVENLISQTELSDALPQLISTIAEDDVAATQIRLVDYRGRRIGRYLMETLGDLCPDTVAASNGSLSTYYKGKLADVVCPNVTWTRMSEDARTLARTLYDFIYQQNMVSPKLL